MKENKNDIFKGASLDKVNIYGMKNKAMFLIITISILLAISILKFKYKVRAYGVVEFIMFVDVIFIIGARASGLRINNDIVISKKFIKIGSLKPIKWENIYKIGFEYVSTYRGKTLSIVVITKCPKERIEKIIGVLSNKKNLRDQIKFLCDDYNIEYYNNVKEKWFKEWWNIF